MPCPLLNYTCPAPRFSLGNTAVETSQQAKRSPRSGSTAGAGAAVPRPVTPGSAARAGIPSAAQGRMERRGEDGSSRSAEDLPGRYCPRDSTGERRGTRREAPGGPDSPACVGGRARRGRSAAGRRPARRQRRAAAGGPCRAAERARTWGRGGGGVLAEPFIPPPWPPALLLAPPPAPAFCSPRAAAVRAGGTRPGGIAGGGSRPSRPLRPATPPGAERGGTPLPRLPGTGPRPPCSRVLSGLGWL